MHQLSVLAEVAPADEPSFPSSVVGLLVLVLAVGVVWWFYRLSTAKVSDEVVEPRARSRRRRGRVDDVPLAPLLPPVADPAPADRAGAPQSVPDSATPEDAATPDSRTVQERLAALDHALAAGTLGSDEHRVLRAALLEE